MVINTVGHLAEAAWHHPDIHRILCLGRGAADEPRGEGRHRQGFRACARRSRMSCNGSLAPRAGALEGTPQTDQRFAYIKYD
jgi:4a-hydroxytetrahydrobiopterin dehydratase